MKALVSLFLVFSLNSFSQVDSAFSFDGTCSRLWWSDKQKDGYYGFEFFENGELKLLNNDSFTGEKWWVEGEHLFTEIRSTRKGTVFRTDYLIKKGTNELLVLDPLIVDRSLQDNSEMSYNYRSIQNGYFTDKLTGHWEGEGENYIQIIPISSFQFQMVLSKNKTEPIQRTEGFLNVENERIVFYMEREGKEIPIYFEAGKGTVVIAGKTYSKKCE